MDLLIDPQEQTISSRILRTATKVPGPGRGHVLQSNEPRVAAVVRAGGLSVYGVN